MAYMAFRELLVLDIHSLQVLIRIVLVLAVQFNQSIK